MHDFFYGMNSRTLYLLSIPSGYRYFLTFIIASSLAVSWVFFVYKPLLQSLKKYTHGQNSSKMLSKNSAFQDDYTTKKKLVEAAECAYVQEVSALQNDRFLDVVNEVVKMLSQHNLIFCSYAPQGTCNEGIFIKHSLLFELKGSFVSLRAFLRDIEKCNYLLIADTIRIGKNTQEELSCTCVISFLQIKKEWDAK